MKKILTDEMIAKIQKLRGEGLSPALIRERLGISIRCLNRASGKGKK